MERTPQQGWKKPNHSKNKNKNKKTHNNNGTRPHYETRDIRGPPNEPQRSDRSPFYSNGNRGTRDNRNVHYEDHRPQEISTGPYYQYGPRDGWGPPPAPPRPCDRSPVHTYNYHAPLRDLRDSTRDDRPSQDPRYEKGYSKSSFLEKGIVYHPPIRTEASRRRSPIRKEDVDEERESRRRQDQ